MSDPLSAEECTVMPEPEQKPRSGLTEDTHSCICFTNSSTDLERSSGPEVRDQLIQHRLDLQTRPKTTRRQAHQADAQAA